MDYITMRARIEDIVNDNHRDFVKAIISIEKGIYIIESPNWFYRYLKRNTSVGEVGEIPEICRKNLEKLPKSPDSKWWQILWGACRF